MIGFKEYTIRKLKAGALVGCGLALLMMGMYVGMYIPSLTWVFLILGLLLFGYGLYVVNKLRYERENEGARLYHYKGRF